MQIQIPDLSKQIGKLGKVAAVFIALGAIGGAYAFYRNNIWRPKVTVISIDWDNQIASLMVGKKQKMLYGSSVTSAGANWGVRFGYTNNKPDRIELVQGLLVYNVLETNKTL